MKRPAEFTARLLGLALTLSVLSVPVVFAAETKDPVPLSVNKDTVTLDKTTSYLKAAPVTVDPVPTKESALKTNQLLTGNNLLVNVTAPGRAPGQNRSTVPNNTPQASTVTQTTVSGLTQGNTACPPTLPQNPSSVPASCPSAPANFRAVATTPNSIHFSWDPVDDAVTYRVFAKGGTITNWFPIINVQSSQGTVAVHNNFAAQTAYDFCVKAESATTGSWCTSVIRVNTPVSIPSAPPVDTLNSSDNFISILQGDPDAAIAANGNQTVFQANTASVSGMNVVSVGAYFDNEDDGHLEHEPSNSPGGAFARFLEFIPGQTVAPFAPPHFELRFGNEYDTQNGHQANLVLYMEIAPTGGAVDIVGGGRSNQFVALHLELDPDTQEVLSIVNLWAGDLDNPPAVDRSSRLMQGSNPVGLTGTVELPSAQNNFNGRIQGQVQMDLVGTNSPELAVVEFHFDMPVYND